MAEEEEQKQPSLSIVKKDEDLQLVGKFHEGEEFILSEGIGNGFALSIESGQILKFVDPKTKNEFTVECRIKK